MPGKPLILDERYYVVMRKKRIVVVDQPRVGFRNEGEAEAWVVGRLNGELERAVMFVIAKGGEIDDGMKRGKETINGS